MTHITFLRHASTDHNAARAFSGDHDLPLNAQGKKEAEVAALKMHDERFDVMLYGKKRRVVQTAQAVLRHMAEQPPVILQTDAIREMHFGKMEGLTEAQVMQAFPGEWAAFMERWQSFTFPGGENTAKFYAHCARFADHIAHDYHGKHILIVAHKGFILACAAHLQGGRLDDMFSRDIQNAQRYHVTVP